MVEIMVVRHGQSEADILNRCEGRADFSLTDLGLQQAQLLAEWIQRNYALDAIFCSTLIRAKQTAAAIAELTQVPVTYDNDLMEQNNGVIAGMLRDEALMKYPIPAGGRKRHDAIEGGESEVQFRARAEHFISKLFTTMDSKPELQRVCIVSHGGMISMLFRAFLNLPYHSEIFIPTGDTGVHLWQYEPSGKKVIMATNWQEHLAAT
ncbi:phosphoglycerate mutase family protein [Paenibacillus vortex V453]|uniref:Phosphoglycerate mutase family protein n=1 Tax=Paenibacillus vortex V453 TaxID=715225 RepID=A0A2R9SSM0_9BACL|nr:MULTISPECIES: histidine phosphatase family protein [Paenibacillus]AWP27815.1 histidine phosphatase family protein [Paenibacillus sp. Cedars]EFU40356.1 phosphoglycerate mutase family protein [Paenibacillus vortex V453]MPY17415.1 histidine phosphatase family protein [Paenibacillus glucanolyticus]